MPIAPTRTLSNQRNSLSPDEFGGAGCVLLMPFNEGSGDPKDYSGYGNHGTRLPAADPPTWVDGRYEKALDFDGDDDIVDIDNPSSLQFGSGDFSVETWVKVSVVLDFYEHIAKGRYGTNCDWTFLLRSNGRVRWQISDGSEAPNVAPNVNVQDGNWHHLVGVRSGDTIELFHNGSSVASTPITSGLTLADTHNIVIGSNADNRDYALEGLVDEVRIYNRALSANEIEAHYLGGRLLKQRSLAVQR